MESATILVVDDEQPIVDLVQSYLTAEGYQVYTASDGARALQIARTLKPDLVVLDVMLPGIDGIEVLRRLHQESSVYVLLLTARSDELDKIVGLAVGADDYMTKPFSPRELVARVRAILRRNRVAGNASAADQSRPSLIFETLLIDPERREVARDGALVELTPREFDLLYALAAVPGRVFTRDQLLDNVWGRDFAGNDRVVDVHIGLLRRKLEANPNAPLLIQTVRGVGYKFTGKRV
jgi:two-component system, OmpR family, alkaline phosphatase synthesis response regulator PhoP